MTLTEYLKERIEDAKFAIEMAEKRAATRERKGNPAEVKERNEGKIAAYEEVLQFINK